MHFDPFKLNKNKKQFPELMLLKFLRLLILCILDRIVLLILKTLAWQHLLALCVDALNIIIMLLMT